MAYNSYNTRNSGRFNQPGRFIPGGVLAPGGPGGMQTRSRYSNYNQNNEQQRPNQYRQNQNMQQQSPSNNAQPVQSTAQQQQQQQAAQQKAVQQHLMQNLDIEMKNEPEQAPSKEGSEPQRPHWMKSKLMGVRKITNKERRRRQNETLRRLLAPKNALMVLNEMLPGEPRETAQFKVEPATNAYPTGNVHTFCAELTVDGTDYKGYGDNKVAARNDAAEQAIRDLIIKRMTKVNNMETNQSTAEGEEAPPAEDEEAPLPMIQLASFALHKLFAEWEFDGHKVPQLKPSSAPQATADDVSEASAGGAGGAGGARARAPRTLPANAATMHPCMLLTYMRPHLEYRELAVEGDRPQNMLFTMGVDVDGVTYIGKATNKREARKQAARSACVALFNVSFEDAAAAGAKPAHAAHAANGSGADVKPNA